MNYNFPQIIFLISSLLAALGLIFIIYSRDTAEKTTKLFILMLIISIAYLISHSIHFLFMRNADVTVLDISCHSFLLLMIVTLTFFTWNYPKAQKMGVIRSALIAIPSAILLLLLWDGKLISESHAHFNKYVAQYKDLYPLFLLWYILLILVNVYWLLKKFRSNDDMQIKAQILLFLVGIIITNFTLFIFGIFLPWITGFYFLIEMSPLAFLSGVILFTSVAIGRYNMFPAALDRVRTFSINKKIFLSALILVPIIILLIEIPLVKIIFDVKSSAELTKYFYITVIGGVFVGVTMTFVILKIISNPIIKLKSKVIEIEKGNYGIKVDFNSNDEIGELTEAFNNMSETLNNNAVELKTKEDRISLLLNAFDKSSAAITIVDNNFKIIEVNETFCKLIGKKKEEAVNRYLGKLQFSKIKNLKFEDIKNEIKKNNGFEGEISQSFGGAEEKHLLISATRAPLNRQNYEGYLFVEVDITDRKKLEAQLLKSEKLAALGKMAAVLAHEIKTPLTSIKMNADILFETLELGKEDRFPISIMQREINRLNNLVKDVLQFSRQMDLVYDKFVIKDLVDDIFSQLRSKLLQKEISFINKVKNIEIEADYGKLKQVFLNLIENAIESCDYNNIIEVFSSLENHAGKIKIFVKDNGMGIANKDKIFEPFFTTKSSGTGLGLPVSQKIIEQHNGEIKLISSKQQETIFEIVLPLNK